MKRKKLPAFISNPVLIEIFQTRPGRVFTNWVLQGMLYMNPIEVIYKLLLDLALMSVILFYLMPDFGSVSIMLAFLIAHTIN